MPYPQTLVYSGSELMDGTEKQLFSFSNIKHRQIFIYLDSLQTGESLEIKTYVKRNSDSSLLLLDDPVTYTSTSTKKIHLIPFISTFGVVVTAKQTGGTFRDIEWEVHEV